MYEQVSTLHCYQLKHEARWTCLMLGSPTFKIWAFKTCVNLNMIPLVNWQPFSACILRFSWTAFNSPK